MIKKLSDLPATERFQEGIKKLLTFKFQEAFYCFEILEERFMKKLVFFYLITYFHLFFVIGIVLVNIDTTQAFIQDFFLRYSSKFVGPDLYLRLSVFFIITAALEVLAMYIFMIHIVPYFYHKDSLNERIFFAKYKALSVFLLIELVRLFVMIVSIFVIAIAYALNTTVATSLIALIFVPAVIVLPLMVGVACFKNFQYYFVMEVKTAFFYAVAFFLFPMVIKHIFGNFLWKSFLLWIQST